MGTHHASSALRMRPQSPRCPQTIATACVKSASPDLRTLAHHAQPAPTKMSSAARIVSFANQASTPGSAMEARGRLPALHALPLPNPQPAAPCAPTASVPLAIPGPTVDRVPPARKTIIRIRPGLPPARPAQSTARHPLRASALSIASVWLGTRVSMVGLAENVWKARSRTGSALSCARAARRTRIL